MHELFIFDLDGTLVEVYGTRPLAGVVTRLDALVRRGCALAVATNQAGPAWGIETGDAKFPTAASLARRFQHVAELLPALAAVPWFVSVHDTRLSLALPKYQGLVSRFIAAGGSLDLHVSAKPDWRKPAPGMLLAVCRHYAIAPERAVFVGDAETDAQAAEAAGTAFITSEDFRTQGSFVEVCGES